MVVSKCSGANTGPCRGRGTHVVRENCAVVQGVCPTSLGALGPDPQVIECWVLLLAQSPARPLITASLTSASPLCSVPLSPSAVPAGATRSHPRSPGRRHTPAYSDDAATCFLVPLPAGAPNDPRLAALTSPAAGPCVTQSSPTLR
ncbi:hypothetical protein NDU88_002942 [Pleurodeles waltl]|uniref:Uncharacterized protein n=1 Tax=Pleurodeles waltl TaxID=8319 RepID=A0AAV7UDS1_PLEWA|nr:hypothetical protein NDU88_002942 [Pleurodeles waltl]